MEKTRVAVFFGGRSPEHDVSIITGLQVLNALPSDKYVGIPLYISPSGEWFTGDSLRDRGIFIPNAESRRKLTQVSPVFSSDGRGRLRGAGGFLSKSEVIFDIAIPAFHGAFGEDGCFQGVMEMAGVPYAGMRHAASAIAMDKVATKAAVHERTSAPQLPYVAVRKVPGRRAEAPALPSGWNYPVIVKPAHLGSSIGVAKADSAAEVAAVLQMIFLYDSKALIEPYVAHRKEYNIAVRNTPAGVKTSAIEMPKSDAALLDFKEKYRSGVGGGAKKTAMPSEGMLSLTRELNPKIDGVLEADLRKWAVEIFEALDGTGAPRLDFIADQDTGAIWFNEINPCPGSFGYFLWEASTEGLLFGELLSLLLDEAVAVMRQTDIPPDPVPHDARLFKRQ